MRVKVYQKKEEHGFSYYFDVEKTSNVFYTLVCHKNKYHSENPDSICLPCCVKINMLVTCYSWTLVSSYKIYGIHVIVKIVTRLFEVLRNVLFLTKTFSYYHQYKLSYVLFCILILPTKPGGIFLLPVCIAIHRKQVSISVIGV